MYDPNDDDATIDPSPLRVAIAIGIGLAAGLIIVVIPYTIVWLINHGLDRDLALNALSGFNFSIVALYPAVQGFAMALALGRERRSILTTAGCSFLLMLIELVGAAIFMREGIICLIILSPLLFGCIWGGAALGRVVARARVHRGLQASLAPLLMLGVFAESTGPAPDHTSVVADSIVIDAPPEYVWRYVLSYPENNTPAEYWLWRAGLPEPVQSVADAPRVGANRVCRFKGGLAFEERITELEPNSVMTFAVTKQPDHPEVTGHFHFDQGQIRLTRNADGSTTVTATSWYRLFVRPAAYFDWWTADITRQVHFRVLNHIKRLAERDYREAQSPQR